MRILVVDDDENSQVLQRAILESSGYEVVIAADGAEALAKARQNPPDLIISDILMPVMDGFALCREWEKDERLRPIPFIFYTATYTDGRDEAFALGLGAERFIIKPEDLNVFVQTIREVIQKVRRQPVAPARMTIEAPQEDEGSYLKQYNETLIHKLEAKMQQLDRTNRELEEGFAVRKREEENLRRMATVVRDSNDAITIQDFEGRITAWNHGAKLMYGYSEEEAFQRNICLLTTTDKLEEQKDFTRRLLAGEKITSFETQRVTKDGRILDVWLTVTKLIDDTGNPIGIASTERDITERKRAEKAMQHKNEELEHFLYAASHDLKSPVVTVRTFLGYLEQDMAAADAGLIEKDMNFIRTATDKMLQLLDDLLEISRIGRLVIPSVSVTFRSLVDEALGTVAGRISERGVTVQVDDREVTMHGDRVRLAEVFQNLVDNACKFMGDQKEPRIEIGWDAREAEPVFFVRDNGIGIDPRFQAKVFGLFEKLDPKAEGTGMGLTLVKRIVELYEGRIWVESSGSGQGTCFYFTLPGAANKTNKGKKS